MPVQSEIMPWQEQLIHQMDRNRLDMATCTLTDVPAAIHGRGVGQDRFVCVLRKSHLLASTGLDLEQYVRYSHALDYHGGREKRRH